MSGSGVTFVLITTIMFADGTPPERQYVQQRSLEQCVKALSTTVLVFGPPPRKHPVEFYSAACAVGTDDPAGLPKKGKW
jgi:hypothetical protein